jgi:hypothetical protein
VGRLTDGLKRIGHEALASAPTDPDRVDGLRFVLRQLADREEQFLEFGRGTKPEFFGPESPTRTLFADWLDTIYRQFDVLPDSTYRIIGTCRP